MPSTNPLEILLDHDRWATRQLLDACGKLTPEQFAQNFDMGPGSLQATLTHIVGAMRVWGDSLAQREVRPRLETSGLRFTPAQLVPMLEEAADELKRESARVPLD